MHWKKDTLKVYKDIFLLLYMRTECLLVQDVLMKKYTTNVGTSSHTHKIYNTIETFDLV
jgi:hypothetical protein